MRTVHVEDGVQAPLEILPVLARDRMADLLGAELEKAGFTRDGNRATRKDPDGIEIEVDLEKATVTVKLGANAKLSEDVELTARVGIENKDHTEASLRDDAQRELETRVAERTEALRREVTKQLEGKLGDLKKELDGAIGAATVAALTERAGQLGRIEEVSADGAGNVTIRVKV